IATLTVTFPSMISVTLSPAGQLDVLGTGGPDHIELRLNPNDATMLEVVTVIGGTAAVQDFPLAGITSVNVDAGGGDDLIVFSDALDAALGGARLVTLQSCGAHSSIFGSVKGIP